MNHNIYIYIFVMAAVTYLIRMLPLTLIRKEIKSTYIKSFLYYVPYVTLAAMTFPAILSAVSYTHLDVYKRQVRILSFKNLPSFRIRLSSGIPLR